MSYVFVLRRIDFMCERIIIKNDNGLLLKWFNRYLLLEAQNSFTLLEDHDLTNDHGATTYYLVLVRNIGDKPCWFKNRVMLYTEDAKIDLIGIAYKIEAEFGIRYAGIIPSSFSSIEDIEHKLKRKKGYIPE